MKYFSSSLIVDFIGQKTWDDIITGLISSAIFLILISLLKPRISIADKIAFSGGIYSFKMINKSLFFKVYDIKVRVFSFEIIPSPNGDDESFEEIKLRASDEWVIKRLYLFHVWQPFLLRGTRLKKRTDYAAQFSTLEDLHSMISARRYISIQVLAKHALTGFSVVKTKSYKHNADIVNGVFLSGNTCEIK